MLHSTLVFISLILSISCSSEAQFSTSVATGKRQVRATNQEVTLDVEASELRHSKFVVGEAEIKEKIDIAWILDESGSMHEENANVIENLSAFELDMAKFSNVKIFNSMTEEWRVESADALSCVLDGLDMNKNNSKCYSAAVNKDIETDKHLKLKKFFREDSKKIFVFVTDDESHLPATDFLDAMKEFAPKALYYSFAGESKEACSSIASPGMVYKELAEASGGKMYNICTEDWSQELKELSVSIKKQTENRFKMDLKEGSKITEVKVNDEVIKEDLYEIKGVHIEFTADFLKAGDEINIIYKNNS
jgi:hypothetical protein